MVRRHQNSNTRFKLIITGVIANKYSLTIIISCNMETQTVDSLYEDGLVMNNLWRLSFWLQVKQASFKAAQIFGLNLNNIPDTFGQQLHQQICKCECRYIQVCKCKQIVVSLTSGSSWDWIGTSWTLPPLSTRYVPYVQSSRAAEII